MTAAPASVDSRGMDWQDEGVILSMRPHGESAAIIEVFTRAHGRHSGIVRGGQSRRMTPHLQPGTQVRADWRARLGEHLGTWSIEPLQSRAHVLGDRLALAGLARSARSCRPACPNGPHPRALAGDPALLDGLGAADWPQAYLRWELRLLEELGFGLDLASCAVTGATEGLAFVSPRTGRAVSREGAGDWADRLLPPAAGPCPRCGPVARRAAPGLAITTHFLTRDLAEALAAPCPRRGAA